MENQDAAVVKFFKGVADSLREESDRACVILIVAWADHFLEMKFSQEFGQGNANARSSLFSSNGAFSTFSAKINAAFCAGWIDRDVYHDLHILRKMRNEFAHSIGTTSLNDERFSSDVAKLRVPRREYYDWGELGAASTDEGAILFNGDRPSEALEDLSVNKITFRMGASVLIAVLVANLGIPVDYEGSAGGMRLVLPEHLREVSS